MSDEKKKSFTPFGLSWPLCLGFIIIVAAGVMTGSLSTDLAGGFAFMLALGIICNEIGERIPFWNSYIEMYPLYWTPSKEGTFCVIRLNLS